MTIFTLEVCVDSFDSSAEAVAGGATRLEVCSALALGGLVQKIHRVFPKIPLMIMIRCREGSFVYNEQEISTMLNEVVALKQYASGFVFGFLKKDYTLDKGACFLFLNAAAPLPCTLHRAFDYTPNWRDAMDVAVSLNFKYILTSGQKATALEGIETLKEMVSYAENRISIMIGSGVNEKTIPKLLSTNARAFHGSVIISLDDTETKFTLGPADSQTRHETSRHIVAILHQTLQQHFCTS